MLHFEIDVCIEMKKKSPQLASILPMTALLQTELSKGAIISPTLKYFTKKKS
jgi:hypothetical protein